MVQLRIYTKNKWQGAIFSELSIKAAPWDFPQAFAANLTTIGKFRKFRKFILVLVLATPPPSLVTSQPLPDIKAMSRHHYNHGEADCERLSLGTAKKGHTIFQISYVNLLIFSYKFWSRRAGDDLLACWAYWVSWHLASQAIILANSYENLAGTKKNFQKV